MLGRAEVDRLEEVRELTTSVWRDALAALLGGVAGSVLGGLAVRAGFKPWQVATGMTVGGGALALASEGTTRVAMGGVAAAGAGQLVMAWRQVMEAGPRNARRVWVVSKKKLIRALERMRRSQEEREPEIGDELDDQNEGIEEEREVEAAVASGA